MGTRNKHSCHRGSCFLSYLFVVTPMNVNAVRANIDLFAAVILVFFTMLFMSPELCKRNTSNNKISSLLAWSSVASSALAFMFLIGIYSVAKYRFEKNGFTASIGNMVRNILHKTIPTRRFIWNYVYKPVMSLVATFLLLLVAISPYFLTKLPEELSRSRSKHRRHRNRDEFQPSDLESQPPKR